MFLRVPVEKTDEPHDASPTRVSQHKVKQEINTNNIWRNARLSMAYRGYQTASKALATTLQGSIWRGINTNIHTIGHFNPNVVVKATNKDLDFKKITVVNGKRIAIQESITSEMNILKYLTHYGMYYGLNQFIVNYIDSFSDETNYYLVMEHGGTTLFNFILKAHQFVSAGKLTTTEWQNSCQMIFTQMVTCLDLLHNT
eukprot:183242_1